MGYRLIIIICFIFCCLFSFSNGQSKLDSLLTKLNKTGKDTNRVKLLIDLAGEFYRETDNLDTSLRYSLTALNLAYHLNYTEGILVTINSTAIYYYHKQQYDSSLYYRRKNILILDSLLRSDPENTRYKTDKVVSYNNIANLYHAKGDYEKTTEYYYKALEISEELGKKSFIAALSLNIGNIFLDKGSSYSDHEQAIKEYDKALELYNKGLRASIEIGSDRGISLAYNNIGTTYESLSQRVKGTEKEKELLAKALDNFFKSLEINIKIEDKRATARSYNNIGQIYYRQSEVYKDEDVVDQKLELALENYKKSMQIREEIQDRIGIANCCIFIGEYYNRIKDYNNAITYSEKAYNIATDIGNASCIRESAEMLYEVYEDQKKYDKALEYYKIVTALKDSMFTVENNEKIAEIETKYETEKKEKEIEILKRDKLLQDAEVSRQISFRNYLIIFSVLIIFLVFVIYNRYRLKRKTNIALTRQNTEIKEQKEEIEQQNEEILSQRDELDTVNKELYKKNTQVTDSIVYAETIQKAILPSDENFNRLFPDSFILFKPRDIVSGDFYWLHEKEGYIYLAVADCTGHGVPGAFMSMIGNTLLNEILHETGTPLPSEVLSKLHTGVTYALKQGKDQAHDRDDGMDITLCRFNKSKGELILSCANRQAYIILKGEIETVEGDIYSIGGAFTGLPDVKFTDHNYPVEDGTIIYMFSDGFHDQFGGADNKKYMVSRFKDLLEKKQNLPMKDQKDILEQEFETWKADKSQTDDVLVVGIRY